MASKTKSSKSSQPRTLRIKSTLEEIIGNGRFGLSEEVQIGVVDLPESCRQIVKGFIEKSIGKKYERETDSLRSIGEQGALLSFVFLESFMGGVARTFNPEKSCLVYLRRVVQAAKCQNIDDENDTKVIVVGQDALVQLARIPDVLSSSACAELSMRLETDVGRIIPRKVEALSELADWRIGLGFRQWQELLRVRHAASKVNYAASFMPRFFRWCAILLAWLEEKNWKDSAFQLNREIVDKLREIGLSVPSADHDAKETTFLKQMFRFYAKELDLKILSRGLDDRK